MKHRLLIIILFFLPSLIIHPQQIYINEFLSSNVSNNADIVDFDDFSDWIELYNPEEILILI